MIVAFLDLLGFSSLLEIDEEVALDNMNLFNEVIRTKVIDELSHPLSEYKEKHPNDKLLHKFVEKSSVTSFEQMISFSDSLVIGSNKVEIFITQLMNFVATIYINYSEPFKKPFTDIRKVETNHVATGLSNGQLRYHNAFPLLFRGGISVGNDVKFFNEYHISDAQLEQTSLNVFGRTYLKAVNLEKTDKGPRLFCDGSVVNAISNKRMIKKVNMDKDIYEIVWTIEGCEATEGSNDKWDNVQNRIYDKMLPAAVNLYKYYESEEKLEPQYRELINLVSCGIIKYANDECCRADDALSCINKYLSDNKINIQIVKNILDDFLA